RGGQQVLPGQGERRHRDRPPANQGGRRRQGRPSAHSHHQAGVRALPRHGRARLPAPGGLTPREGRGPGRLTRTGGSGRRSGHPLEEIRRASDSGRLAFGYIEDLFPEERAVYSLEEAAADTGLEPALIERIYLTIGFNVPSLERISDEDLQFLRYIAAVLAAG